MASHHLPNSLLFFFLLSFLLFIVQAQVPQNETFTFVNEGEFGPYIVEYGGNYRVLSIFAAPFQLAFYNTTPNAYTLALRMGLQRQEPLYRWVWEANRGKPVGENATFSLGADGNLVLADADGRVAWQSNTSNKGVVGFRLLPIGNMVLYDTGGNYVWQSFDYPTDTLLVGQYLRKGMGPSKLVSRLSEERNVDGPYSMVLEDRGLALCYKSKPSPSPILYFFSSELLTVSLGTLENVTLTVTPDTDELFAFFLNLEYQSVNSSDGGTRSLARPKYNATLSFLRLGMDGNVRLYTYYDKVDFGPWEVTFTLFDRDSLVSECELPERCGEFGLCYDNQCVACPLPNGLAGWSKDCRPKPLMSTNSCRPDRFRYYKLKGVDHYMTRYTSGDGGLSENGCGSKCTGDCKCVAYFYRRDTSRCWIAYDLKTLTKVANSTHMGYIKAPKN